MILYFDFLVLYLSMKKCTLKDILCLPDHIITENIFTFYNPYKIFYDYSISELKSKCLFNKCMRQFKQYSIYDKNKNFISFRKDALLTSGF